MATYGAGKYASGVYSKLSESLYSTAQFGSGTYSDFTAVATTNLLSASEAGLDQLVIAGQVRITSVLLASDGRQDSISATGSVEWAVFAGSLAALESQDLLSSSGVAQIVGIAVLEETDADVARAIGTVQIVAELSGIEIWEDAAKADASAIVSAVFGSADQDADTVAGQGAVQVSGSIQPVESVDVVNSIGKVKVQGQQSAAESSDAVVGNGRVLVFGAGATVEFGDDSVSGFANAIVTAHGVTLTEPQLADTAFSTGSFDINLNLSVQEALLLQAIYNLHGLSPTLTVSTSFRKAGEVHQDVETSTTVTKISTTTLGSDTLHKDIGVMIQELAALHGLTDELVVTHSSRSAGPISQSLTKFGGVTTVTRQ
jgi:hypothetical protein